MGRVWTDTRRTVPDVIVLVGFMGAGKSTVGALLAQRLGLDFFDVDDVIAERAAMPVAALFDRHGEPHFRELEKTTVVELMGGPDAVIALGGGAAEHELVRQAIAGATVVYLQVSHEQALARVGHDRQRPVLRRSGPEELARLHEHRIAAYRSVADITVSTDARTTADVIVNAVINAQNTCAKRLFDIFTYSLLD